MCTAERCPSQIRGRLLRSGDHAELLLTDLEISAKIVSSCLVDSSTGLEDALRVRNQILNHCLPSSALLIISHV